MPVVVYGDGPGDAAAAARRLGQLGYENVSLLAGGLDGWAASGGELFIDVNAPSKAFGELVEAAAGTPAVDARELRALLDGPADLVVLDARRFEEYQVMSIPTATSVPGAELVLRARALAPDPATTVVVNCAGRTRSIIGTQSLINSGLPNRVVALRNGTMGWTLAGLALDHGQAAGPPASRPRPRGPGRGPVRGRPGRGGPDHRRRAGRPDDGTRTVYRFDVRTPEEYAAGHRPGFRPAPGGQLVQETDWFAPVRGAVIVLDGDDGGRADMTASWLAQMGWAVVLRAGRARPGRGPRRGPAAVRPPPPGRRGCRPARPGDTGCARAGPGWSTSAPAPGTGPGTCPARPGHCAPNCAPAGPAGRLVLTSPDGYLAAFAAAEVAAGRRAGRRDRRLGPVGPAARVRAPASCSRPGGRLPAALRGHRVDPAAMQAYLDWEYGLVAQLERDGTHHFTVLT